MWLRASWRGGAWQQQQQQDPVCWCGCLVLLVPGPDEQELTAAVGRLVAVLQQLAAAPAVPLVVLSCCSEGRRRPGSPAAAAPGHRHWHQLGCPALLLLGQQLAAV